MSHSSPRFLCILSLLTLFLLCPMISYAQTNPLTTKQQSIIPIAAFTAKGDVLKLKDALIAGLDNGMTINEIKEVLVQMYAYTGFPRSLTALNTFISVLDERKAQGKNDVLGKDASPLPPNTDIHALGSKNQTTVIGKPASGRIYDFAPIMDTFLKEHLFGDIFARDVLTFQERELATVSALAALPAPAQLRSHLSCCLVVGLSAEQLQAFTLVLQNKVGTTEAKLAKTTLQAVMQAKQ